VYALDVTQIALPERPTPRLVSSNPPSVGFIEFAAGALERHAGSEIEFDDFYLAYWQHVRRSTAARWHRPKP
jgi:hypothetical protein